MDKRWIYILIIFIIGISCLYLVADSSTTIGKATVKVNAYLITIPDSFNIDNTGGQYAQLINRNTKEYITIVDLGKGDLIKQSVDEKTDSLENNGSFSNIDKFSLKIDDDSIPSISYESYDNNTINQVSYFTKYNHTFSIESTNFLKNDTIKDNVKFIIDSLAPNYKQKQD
ncbi:MAG: hypothetical protein IJL02_07915 [Methanobrevibacter sp.]|uniref:hypothetical protein n=1 Tax=Methanobrevibacter sp. TaxID=66852 RepID=UPI0025F7D101|nr:hypothetical protein [Methanobrevibacter sp.]MBQ6099768.1 hypothetical protein [Methanobrevibacter sp.]